MISILLAVLFIINTASSIDVSPYFEKTGDRGGVNGGVKFYEPDVGGVKIGGMMDSDGHSQGISGGFRIDADPNTHIDIGGFRGRGGNVHGGGISLTFDF